MDFGLTAVHARHVEALLRGDRQPTTAQDRLILETVAALRAWPRPAIRPEFQASLRARLLAEPIDAVFSDATATATAPTPASVVAAEAAVAAISTPAPASRVARDPASRAGVPGQRGAASGRAGSPGDPASGRAGRMSRGGRHAADRAATRRAAGSGAAAGDPARGWAGRLTRPALIGALATSVAAVGLTAGSRAAMPGDPLYSVKLHVEQLQVTLADSAAKEAEVRLGLARTRMDELQELVQRSGPTDEDVPRLLEAWQEEVDRSSGVLLDMAANGDSDARAVLEAFTADQAAQLADVVEALSGDAATRRTAQTCLDIIEELEFQLRSSAMPAPGPSADDAGTSRLYDSEPSPSSTPEPANSPTEPPPAQVDTSTHLPSPGDSTAPNLPPEPLVTSNPQDEPVPAPVAPPLPDPTATSPLSGGSQPGSGHAGQGLGNGLGNGNGIGNGIGNGSGQANGKSSAVGGATQLTE